MRPRLSGGTTGDVDADVVGSVDMALDKIVYVKGGGGGMGEI